MQPRRVMLASLVTEVPPSINPKPGRVTHQQRQQIISFAQSYWASTITAISTSIQSTSTTSTLRRRAPSSVTYSTLQGQVLCISGPTNTLVERTEGARLLRRTHPGRARIGCIGRAHRFRMGPPSATRQATTHLSAAIFLLLQAAVKAVFHGYVVTGLSNDRIDGSRSPVFGDVAAGLDRGHTDALDANTC